MSAIFDKSTDNVLDLINADDELADHFAGDFFNGADSNFLGIAIGKKARARKAARRRDRQAGRKYKLETERIRALQGQPKQNVIADITNGLGSLAKVALPFLAPGAAGALGGEQEQPYDENYPMPGQSGGNNQGNWPTGGNNYDAPAPKNNTILYVGIAIAVLIGAYLIIKK